MIQDFWRKWSNIYKMITIIILIDAITIHEKNDWRSQNTIGKWIKNLLVCTIILKLREYAHMRIKKWLKVSHNP